MSPTRRIQASSSAASGPAASAAHASRTCAVVAGPQSTRSTSLEHGTNYDFGLLRLTVTGTREPTFGSNGQVVTPIGAGDDVAYGVASDGSDRIVVAGYSWNGSNADVAVVRWTTSGSLDASFSGDGKMTTALGFSDDFTWDVVVDGNGKIVGVGRTALGSRNAATRWWWPATSPARAGA